MTGINPFAKAATPEPDYEPPAPTPSALARIFDVMFGSGVAYLPPPPLQPDRISKRRMRRLRGKAKAAR